MVTIQQETIPRGIHLCDRSRLESKFTNLFPADKWIEHRDRVLLCHQFSGNYEGHSVPRVPRGRIALKRRSANKDTRSELAPEMIGKVPSEATNGRCLGFVIDSANETEQRVSERRRSERFSKYVGVLCQARTTDPGSRHLDVIPWVVMVYVVYKSLNIEIVQLRNGTDLRRQSQRRISRGIAREFPQLRCLSGLHDQTAHSCALQEFSSSLSAKRVSAAHKMWDLTRFAQRHPCRGAFGRKR